MITFTQKDLQELMESSKDPVYFINNYVKINNLEEGLTSIKLRENQEEAINQYHNNRFTVCLSERQKGKTLLGTLYCLYYATFNSCYTVAILSPTKEISYKIRDLIHSMYENLPKFLQMGIIKYNKSIIEFENGSSIRFSSASTAMSGLRGCGINLLYLDEFGIIPDKDAEEIVDAVLPMIVSSKNSKLIISSTDMSATLQDLIADDCLKFKFPTVVL